MAPSIFAYFVVVSLIERYYAIYIYRKSYESGKGQVGQGLMGNEKGRKGECRGKEMGQGGGRKARGRRGMRRCSVINWCVSAWHTSLCPLRHPAGGQMWVNCLNQASVTSQGLFLLLCLCPKYHDQHKATSAVRPESRFDPLHSVLQCAQYTLQACLPGLPL